MPGQGVQQMTFQLDGQNPNIQQPLNNILNQVLGGTGGLQGLIGGLGGMDG